MTGSGAIALGGAVLTTVGIGVGVMAIPKQPPAAVLIVGVLVPIVAGLFLIAWGALRLRREQSSPPGRALIRGRLKGSVLDDVYTEADTVVDGNVHNSRFRKIDHRPKGH